MAADHGPEDLFRLEFEWLPAAGVTSPDLAATWASLTIWIAGECVTQVEDTVSGSARRSLHVSLYPLAEWAAYNWWFLNSHSRPALDPEDRWRFDRSPQPWEAPRPSWLQRHNMRAAADGFPWPDLALVPDGDLVRARWFSDHRIGAGSRVRFLGAGGSWLPRPMVMRSLAGMVESVISRLESQQVKGTPLQQEWEAIRLSDPEELAFSTAAARLGCDPYRADDEPGLVAALLAGSERLAASTLDELLEVSTPATLADTVDWIDLSTARIRKFTPHPAVESVALRMDPKVADPYLPWLTGYIDARAVRQRLGLREEARFPIDDFVSSLDEPGPDPAVAGVVGVAERGPVPVVRGRPLPAVDANFLGARALGHSLTIGSSVALVTDAHTAAQRRSRSFAAEVLAPARGIAMLLDERAGMVAADRVAVIATHFNVSPLVVEHQVQNQLHRRVSLT